jgi:hypothetical protein
MADMSNCPRNSVELSFHESVMAGQQTFAPRTLPKKSLTLTKSVAAVLAVCALLFIGVLGVARYRWIGNDASIDDPYSDGFYCKGNLLTAEEASYLEEKFNGLSIKQICDAMTSNDGRNDGR